ncbi:glucosyltransferase domain-containing protein [Butyrivibrio sp.]|uniref:glucosyltransferase domain-containing protein n=1 Tax=Butyrivibrio sp. TaxID=28121 RepID=UPI0025C57ED5|nr:glucosyltransferase domain-containing protein [Butyrivibrio sp.]MBE5838017.1 hypothetical protein [Butyrivibrio sp.]
MQTRMTFNLKRLSIICFFTALAGILSYYIFIIDGHGHIDALGEGLYYYMNADWATMCGRWGVRYLLSFFGNIVIPGINVAIYVMCVAISCYLLAELYKIDSVLLQVIMAMAFISSPTICCQLVFAYLVPVYAFSLLLSVFSVYYFRFEGIKYTIISSIFIFFMMGLYQPYLGMALGTYFVLMVLDFIDEKNIGSIFIQFFKFILAMLVGCGLDIIVYKMEMHYRALQEGSRVAQFSISGILLSLGSSIIEIYGDFAHYFWNGKLNLRYYYLFLFIVLLVFAIKCEIRLFRRSKIAAICATVVILALPAAMGVIKILIPYNGISSIMHFQYILVIPLAFSLFTRVNNQLFDKYIYYLLTIVTSLIVFSCVIINDASFMCQRISYRAIEKQCDIIIKDAMEIEGYVRNNTPIILVGAPDDSQVVSRLPIYEYSLLPRPIIYNNMAGINDVKFNYFIDYYGVYTGKIFTDEYKEFVLSDEFYNMPVWPTHGSVVMNDGVIFVKLTTAPYVP